MERDDQLGGVPNGNGANVAPREGDVVSTRNSSPSWILQALTGEILLSEQMKRFYALLVAVGVIFFLSIATIFASLRADLRRSKLQSEVEALAERAIRTTEELHHNTSHSAIVRKLKARGIEMQDPQTQPKILK